MVDELEWNLAIKGNEWINQSVIKEGGQRRTRPKYCPQGMDSSGWNW